MTTLTAADARSPWVARAARLGMTASGVLYLTVAWLAVQVADEAETAAADSGGALRTIAAAPFGRVALSVLAAGFAGYALWRFLVAALGEKVESSEDVTWAKRLWYVARGLVYLALCVSTVSILFGADEQGSQERRSAAEALSWPGGRWLVGGVGLAVIGYGLGSAVRGLLRKFEKDLRTHEMSRGAREWLCRIGQVGWIGRGAVFALVGAFLVQAALERDAKESKGLDGALQEVATQPYGRYLLGAAAVGLAAYGAFQLVRARYRAL
jgi:hypothetical protein